MAAAYEIGKIFRACEGRTAFGPGPAPLAPTRWVAAPERCATRLKQELQCQLANTGIARRRHIAEVLGNEVADRI